MKKLAPSSLEIQNYTTDTVKNVCSHMFYLVHPNTKKLMDVTFFVVVNDGSVLLSCKTKMMPGLIWPKRWLNYLPSRSSLITRSADHTKKTKSTLCVQKQEVFTQSSTHVKWLLKCLDRNMRSPSWLQAKNRFCVNILISLKGLIAFKDHPIIYKLIKVWPHANHAIQFLYTLKRCLNKK